MVIEAFLLVGLYIALLQVAFALFVQESNCRVNDITRVGRSVVHNHMKSFHVGKFIYNV